MKGTIRIRKPIDRHMLHMQVLLECYHI